MSWPWPWYGLPQMVPFGNTSKNVATELFTASRSVSNNWMYMRDDAAPVEMLLHHLEEFLGVQVCRAFHPRIQRIDSDSVEAFLGCHQVMPPIVDPHLDLGIAEDIEIRLAEVGGSGLRHQRLDFHDGLAFHSWIDGHRARRDTRAAADHQDRARVLPSSES